MKQYKNYVFDLYGTLVDIKADEKDKTFWEKISELYSHFGVDYTKSEIEKTYKEYVKEEEEKLVEKNGSPYPEIELERVFIRLFTEGKNKHNTKIKIPDLDSWAVSMAAFFRVESREYIKPYKDTIDTLKELKRRGVRIYLLSNAQKCFTQAEMEITGVEPYLDDIFLSSDYEIKKPDPRFLQELIKKHGLRKEETVMVGNDTISDIGIAEAVGIDSILINTFKYSNEYIKKTCKKEPVVINTLKELLD
ncbi:MAG: HAD family hydrolase [Lachnospiraceae bacterium]|nr:HAD family hydrolase [Lachnospiraceae bacterium]